VNIFGFSDGSIVAYRLVATGIVDIEKVVTVGGEWQLKKKTRRFQSSKKITAKSWKDKFPETYNSYQEHNLQPELNILVKAIVTKWLDLSETGYPANSVKIFPAPYLLFVATKIIS